MLVGVSLVSVVLAIAVLEVARPHALLLTNAHVNVGHANELVWTRARDASCTGNTPQIVRLSTRPGTGSTWLQCILEEITHVATQNPQSVPQFHPLKPHLYLGEEVTVRAQCGAQLSFWSPDCTSENKDSSSLHLATGGELEIFKNHYPSDDDLALFETSPPIAKTILVIRNPIDAYLAEARQKRNGARTHDILLARHVATHRLGNLGARKRAHAPVENLPRASMRSSTIGHGIDPFGVSSRHEVWDFNFAHYLRQWVNFYSFWLEDAAAECTEVIVIRYEDLVTTNLIGGVLKEVVELTGIVATDENAVDRAVEKYHPNPSSLGHEVFFNKTLALDSDVLDMVITTIKAEIQLIEKFGYKHILHDLWMLSTQEKQI